ncbi:MAG: SprB repeat-containing protein, partial [Bacteroidota bacterium]
GAISYCGLIEGCYAVRVTDNAGNQVLDSICVLAPPAIGFSFEDTLPSCSGESDGSIRVRVTEDGFPVADPVAAGFTFTWDPVQPNTDIITGLDAPMNYSVTVTSPTGCTISGSLPLGDPARIIVLPTDPTDAVNDATCFGAEDGDITVSAMGGTSASGEYTFTWNTVPPSTATGTSVNLSGLDPGIYTVTVEDDNGCTEEATFNVAADKELSVNAVITPIQCFGDDNGEIFATGVTTINIPMGTPDLPYTFTWSANAPASTDDDTTTEIDGLPPGTYNLNMVDASGCEIDTFFTITEPAELVVADIQTTNETCETGNDGSATVIVNGGTYPYTYQWSHSIVETDSVATGLAAGTNYMVTVTDANGCERIGSYNISSPLPPQIQQFDDDFVSCPDAMDGTLTVVATDGSAAIASYAWADGDGNNLGVGPTTTTLNNLSPGIYIVTITAVDACFTVDTAEVFSPGPIVIDSIGLTTPTCPGESNGLIFLEVIGGTPPYTYTWSTNPNVPGTINPLTGLAANTYSVTITDANNCTPLIETIVLPEPPSIVGTFSNLLPVSCPDDVTCNGSATIDAAYEDGSTGIFNITWENEPTEIGVTSSTLNNLCRGPVSVSISDGQCGATFTDTIQSPEDIVIGVQIERVSCFGESDGEVTLAPQGGTPPFTYQWVPTGGMGPTEDNLPAGVYTAIVQDDNGCARQQIVEVTQPDELVLDVDPVQTTNTVRCAGDENGIISVFVSSSNNNPLIPAPFTWSGGVAPPASPTATGLPPGTYSVTVTDVKGCMDDLTWTIGEPSPITFSVLPIEEPLCFGQTTLVGIDTAFG